MNKLINPNDVRNLFEQRDNAVKRSRTAEYKNQVKQAKKYIIKQEENSAFYNLQLNEVKELCRILSEQILELNKLGAKIGRGPVDIGEIVEHRLCSQERLDKEYDMEVKTNGAINPSFLDIRFKPYIEEKLRENENRYNIYGN